MHDNHGPLLSTVFRAICWLGGHELSVLLGMLTIIGGTWAFLALAGEVIDGDTQTMDERIVRAFRRADNPVVPLGPPWMVEMGRDITALGGYAILILLLTAVTGFLALDRKFSALAFVLAAVIGGYTLSMGLKAVFDRPRPDLVPHLSYVGTTSFPSGHSMMSAIVFLTLGALLTRLVTSRPLKFYFLAIALILTGLVGASRVYLGVHYPTDVLAGWTAGLVWSAACWLIARRLQRRGTLEKRLSST